MPSPKWIKTYDAICDVLLERVRLPTGKLPEDKLDLIFELAAKCADCLHGPQDHDL